MKKILIAFIFLALLTSARAQDIGGGLNNLSSFSSSPNVSNATGVLPAANGGTSYYAIDSVTTSSAANSCPALQTLINSAEAAGGGVIYGSSFSMYKCTGSTGLTYDPLLVSFEWSSGGIDASGMSGGNLFNNTSTSSIYNHAKTFFRDGYFIGNSNVNLFVFNNTSTFTSSMYADHIAAYGFKTAETYEQGAYLIGMNNVQYAAMGTCFSMPSGYTNYGENISHTVGSCANSTLGVYSNTNSGSNTQTFNNFSFDFNGQIVDDETGFIYFNTPHFESNGSALTGVLFKAADSNGTNIIINGGDWLLDGSGPFSGATALIESDGAAVFKAQNLFMHNTALTSGTIGTGTGKILFDGTRGYTQAQGNYQIEGIGGTSENFLADGGFEQSTIKDLVWISADTSAITSRFTGANIVLTNDSATCGGHTGTQSLKLNKTFGAGSAAIANIGALYPADKMGIFSFWYSKPGSQTGTVNFNFYAVHVDSNGLPLIDNQSATLGNINPTFTSSPTGWTQVTLSQNNSNILPKWANAFVLQVNMNSMNGGALCIDDVVFNGL